MLLGKGPPVSEGHRLHVRKLENGFLGDPELDPLSKWGVSGRVGALASFA